MKNLAFALAGFAALAAAPALHAQTPSRDADTAAIRAHIESIFDGFINKDRARLEATHGERWRGFLDGSREKIRGRDGYMRAIEGTFRVSPGQGMVGYTLNDFDVVFYGENVGVASFVAEVRSKYGQAERTAKLNIVDTYARENGRWIQVASGTALNQDTLDAQASTLQALPESARTSLMAAREAVWRAWYAGDTAALGSMLPRELVTLAPDRDGWGTRESIIKASAEFAKSGAALSRLEFPRTEMQAYGSTVILYSSYALDLRQAGTTRTETGKATEIFVWTRGQWINTGWQLAPEPAR